LRFHGIVYTFALDVPIEVRLSLRDDPSDGVDTIAAFVDHVELDVSGRLVRDPSSGETRPCTAGYPTSARNGDGYTDAVGPMPPGVCICGVVVPKPNTTVPAMMAAQIFRATLHAEIDGRSPVDARDVYFFVPPTP
jgi:hypothetical protein